MKKILKPPGMDPRHGLKKTYKNILFGLGKILKGDLRLDYLYGKTQYHPIYPFEGDIPDKFEHDFAIAAIVKNEGRYLKEWIEFHRLIGCSKFFIYDNSSTDNTRDILVYYADLGVVEWVNWPHMNPWLNTQQLAYCHAIYMSRGRARWLALIDADEFMFSPPPQNLITFLNEYNDLPALVVYWDMFGTSGHEKRPDGLLVENFTRRLDVTHPLNRYRPLAKSIVQPHAVRAVSSVHSFQTDLWPALGFDENRILIKKISDIHPQKKIRLNHYYTKSLQDWNERLNRSWAASGYRIKNNRSLKIDRYKKTFEEIHRVEVIDTTCHFLLPDLKQRLINDTTLIRKNHAI